MSVFSNRSIDPPQERAKYSAAILELVGGREPMSILRETPAAASRAIEGLSAAQLRKPEAPGKWSIAQVLQHLADSDLVWGWRMRLILAQDRPVADRIRPGSVGRSPALRGRGSGARARNTARASPRQPRADRSRHARRSQACRRPCRARRRKRRVFDRLIRRARPAASSPARSHSCSGVLRAGRSQRWRAGLKSRP